MHSLVVQGSKKTPILSMDHFDKAIASRLDRTRNGDDIRFVRKTDIQEYTSSLFLQPADT